MKHGHIRGTWIEHDMGAEMHITLKGRLVDYGGHMNIMIMSLYKILIKF